MGSTKIKTLIIVSVLLLAVGITAVGCKKKPANAWVNTSSMPGNTFANHTNTASKNKSTVVYLGSDDTPGRASSGDFGPKDVSFEFKNLR